MESPPIRVAPMRLRLLLVTPTRFVLAAGLVGAALAEDARARSVLLAFAVGTVLVAVAALADRRALLLRGDREPGRLPPDAVVDPAWRVAVDAALPSTV